MADFRFNPIPIADPGAARQEGERARQQNRLLEMQQQALQQNQLYQQQDRAAAQNKAQQEQRLQGLQALRSVAQQADNPDKWNAAVNMYAQALGPEAVAPYRDFSTRESLLMTVNQEMAKLLSPEEAKAAGFQPGSVVQKDNSGYKVVQQPEKPGETWRPATAQEKQAAGLAPTVAAQVNQRTNKIDTIGSSTASSEPLLDNMGLDLAATDYRKNGKIPPGMSRNPRDVARIIGRAAEQAREMGMDNEAVALDRQAFSARKSALSKLQTQKSMVGAFEKTAQKNLDLAVQMSDELARSSSPIANRVFVNFQKGVTGDPATAKFVNALIAARTEYAKVLSGATGAQGITDAARRESEELFNTATNAETLRQVVQLAKQEMANRMIAFDEQIAELNPSKPQEKPQQAQQGWSIERVE